MGGLKRGEFEERCTGHCCKSFYFRFDPEELKSIVESYKAWDEFVEKRKEDPNMSRPDLYYTDRNGKEVFHCYPREEVEQIHGMLIHLGKTNIIPETGEKVDREFDTYTCKNFDGENCTIYESRPNMCKIHPTDGVCGYKECTASCAASKLGAGLKMDKVKEILDHNEKPNNARQ